VPDQSASPLSDISLDAISALQRFFKNYEEAGSV